LFAATEGIQCKNCHQINKVGTAIGPDLSHVGKQLTRAQILQSILTPSEKINPKFVTYLAETSQGRIITGLLIEKNKQRVVLRNARNQRIEIQASDLELLVPQPKSLMPDLLFKDLSAKQLADLIAYLHSLK
jgi:putative heme-binding domain-containing protein